MELRQIQYFICLYEDGTVTRAARRLNIVQPALSMQIARLEEELGQQLFERSQRGMQPTSVARQMYRLFLPLVRDFNEARKQLQRKDDTLSGHVNVGIVASVAQGVLADVLTDFSQRYPNVTLTISDGFSMALADRVAGGELDAAFINKPRRALSLNIEPVVEESVVLVSAATRETPLPARIPFSTVAKLDLALPSRSHGLRNILDSFAQTAEQDLVAVFEIDSVSTIITLVERTRFVTLLPWVAVRDAVQAGRLRCHQVIRPKLARQIVCVTHPRRGLSAEAAALVAQLSLRMQALGIEGPAGVVATPQGD